MKTKIILFGMILLIVVAGGFVFFNSGSTGSAVVGNIGGDVQKVVLSMKNYNYYPSEITVKAGQPVELSLDKSVVGCLRSFTIKDFGVSKYLETPTDTVTFTPTKKGTFSFACSMGMAFGKIKVV